MHRLGLAAVRAGIEAYPYLMPDPDCRWDQLRVGSG
jgi:hypothetical protein